MSCGENKAPRGCSGSRTVPICYNVVAVCDELSCGIPPNHSCCRLVVFGLWLCFLYIGTSAVSHGLGFPFRDWRPTHATILRACSQPMVFFCMYGKTATFFGSSFRTCILFVFRYDSWCIASRAVDGTSGLVCIVGWACPSYGTLLTLLHVLLRVSCASSLSAGFELRRRLLDGSGTCFV